LSPARQRSHVFVDDAFEGIECADQLVQHCLAPAALGLIGLFLGIEAQALQLGCRGTLEDLLALRALGQGSLRFGCRIRHWLDAQSNQVLQAEIAKLTSTGLMVTLRPHQMLHLFVSRARQCQCGAEERELPALAPSTTGATDAARRSVEVDAYVRASLVAEAQRLADAGGPHLNQHQVLRVMLMRAARCRCGAPYPVGAGQLGRAAEC
jgi:hypothetical protein